MVNFSKSLITGLTRRVTIDSKAATFKVEMMILSLLAQKTLICCPEYELLKRDLKGFYLDASSKGYSMVKKRWYSVDLNSLRV